MHNAYVDITQTISRAWKVYYSEMCYCMPVNSGEELGKRVG